jgi:hypothetical protein
MRYVDLAASVNGKPFLYEIKTTTEKNFLFQIRRGISQLYEYRYLQGALKAGLVLVMERPIPPKFGWIIDYLVHDRMILPVWNGDGERLFCPETVRNTLFYL